MDAVETQVAVDLSPIAKNLASKFKAAAREENASDLHASGSGNSVGTSPDHPEPAAASPRATEPPHESVAAAKEDASNLHASGSGNSGAPAAANPHVTEPPHESVAVAPPELPSESVAAELLAEPYTDVFFSNSEVTREDQMKLRDDLVADRRRQAAAGNDGGEGDGGEDFGQAEPTKKPKKKPSAKAKAAARSKAAKAKASPKSVPKAKAKGKAKAKSSSKRKAGNDVEEPLRDTEPLEDAEPVEDAEPLQGGEPAKPRKKRAKQDGEKLTFAGRPKPGKDILAIRRWEGIKNSFELHVKPHIKSPSGLEASCF
ncbi:unnamed protein product [Symbiodinium natans]|uniref:Uncharacterized protein n=1 Tax=Symbiodinium natans TaxID=878477 RepID=A0A812JQV0_9DINO|nr:unnamed protein product [Symbiodinium natans]